MTKIKIGISSCLLGENVRYDGGHKLDGFLKDFFNAYADYIPICPEVESGLGVPRESMRLEGEPDNPRLLTTAGRKDMTGLLVAWANKKVVELEKENICGFILKSRSPSCGIKSVIIHNGESQAIIEGDGIFSRILIMHFPRLPVKDEESLRDSKVRKDFIGKITKLQKIGGKALTKNNLDNRLFAVLGKFKLEK